MWHIAQGDIKARMLVPYDYVDRGLVQIYLGFDAVELALADCLLALSHDAKHLLICVEERLLLLPQQSTGPPQLLAVHEADAVCSLCWLREIALAGCTSGRLLAWSTHGLPLWDVALQSSPLIALQPCCRAELDLLCLFKNGTLACVPSKLQASPASDGTTQSELGKVWQYTMPQDTERGDECHAVAWCGAVPLLALDLEEAMDDPLTLRACLVAANSSELQLHLVDLPKPRQRDEQPPRRFRSFVSLFGPARGTNDSSQHTKRAADPKLELAHHRGQTSCVRTFTDSPRAFANLVPEPRRKRWLLAPDLLGRVLLLEPKSLVCLRVFKGYRDAQCGWIVPAGTESHACSHLVLYAPRRGLLEVWQAPCGGRVFACNVGHGCVLLSPPPSDDLPSVEHSCFLLQPTGILSKVSLSAAAGVFSSSEHSACVARAGDFAGHHQPSRPNSQI